MSHCGVNAGPRPDRVYNSINTILKPLSKARYLGCILKELVMTFISRQGAPGIKKNPLLCEAFHSKMTTDTLLPGLCDHLNSGTLNSFEVWIVRECQFTTVSM